jgi:hypothetical protein
MVWWDIKKRGQNRVTEIGITAKKRGKEAKECSTRWFS